MNKFRAISFFNRSVWIRLSTITAFIITGCAHTISYDLTEDEVTISSITKPFNILVTNFSDLRPPEECLDSVRTEMGYENIGDYTYDSEFEEFDFDEGDTVGVSDKISKMVSEHLVFSNVFSKLEFASVPDNEITYEFLDSLHNAGFDAVLMGEINHFYGFYYVDAIDLLVPPSIYLAIALPAALLSIKTQYIMGKPYPYTDNAVLYGGEALALVAEMLGTVAVNSRERNFEWHTNLNVRLINTSNYEIVWEDTFESHSKGKKAFTGFGKDKFKLVNESLRDVVNQMVESLSNSSFDIEAINNQTK